MKMTGEGAFIYGWGHTRFGRSDSSLEEMMSEAIALAIESAEIEPDQIDEIVVGQFNSGLVPLSFVSGLVANSQEALRFKPSTHVENACASGSAAMMSGLRALEAGRANTVLVVGAEKMTHAAPDHVGHALMGADYERAGEATSVGFAELFAEVANAYQEKHGDVRSWLAHIASKNHTNGADNPWAHFQKKLTFDECNEISDRNPLVAPPLRRTDCSPVSDGAAAVILGRNTDKTAGVVRLRTLQQAGDFLSRSKRSSDEFLGAEAAWAAALKSVGMDVWDLDFIELHDCFTIAELILYESLGLFPKGEGYRALDEGIVYADGPMPVNRSGGLKAKGHPVGATGVSQHVMACMQLTDTAGAMQLSKADTCGIFNMGGLAVANYASILERV